MLSKLARFFDWRSALVIVKPATLIGWHRAAFRRFSRWKSRSAGRPPISADLRLFIRRMAAENLTCGEERIADELLLKFQIRVSPRTVRKYIARPKTSAPAKFCLSLHVSSRMARVALEVQDYVDAELMRGHVQSSLRAAQHGTYKVDPTDIP